MFREHFDMEMSHIQAAIKLLYDVLFCLIYIFELLQTNYYSQVFFFINLKCSNVLVVDMPCLKYNVSVDKLISATMAIIRMDLMIDI